jgi:hypothetical protein
MRCALSRIQLIREALWTFLQAEHRGGIGQLFLNFNTAIFLDETSEEVIK